VPGGGTHRAGQGAFGNMCRGGHMYSPTKARSGRVACTRGRRRAAFGLSCIAFFDLGFASLLAAAPRAALTPPAPPLSWPLQIWRRWHRKINIKQKRYAVASALAASALPSLVMARGHKIDAVPEVPLVVSNAAEALKKTSKALELLAKIGASADVNKSKDSKNLHKGKGKMRNRRYTMRRGPLVIYANDEGITHAFRNIPGVELAHVERLNLLQLAPGGHMGRFCIWTKSAFEKLDSVFGTASTLSSQKHGFKIPRALMSNPDLNRVINSDEIQSIVKAPKNHHARAPLKKNPLTNLGAMLKLNPYAKARFGAVLIGLGLRALCSALVLQACRGRNF
jgi:large subunit ribosomal protein L4e